MRNHEKREQKRMEQWEKQEMQSHHVLGRELIADGFVSALVLPADRLRELIEDVSGSMEGFCAQAGLSEQETRFLLENEHIEPSPKQLMLLSRRFDRSLLWLLGYHAPEAPGPATGESEIYVALSKRNAAEATVRRTRCDGLINEYIYRKAQRRAEEANKIVASTAAHILSAIHYPLTEREIRLLDGQPVFIEYVSQEENTEWGLSCGTHLLTTHGELQLDSMGETFSTYQTPHF